MGSAIVDVRVRGTKGGVLLKVIVNIGFYGEVIALPKVAVNVLLSVKKAQV